MQKVVIKKHAYLSFLIFLSFFIFFYKGRLINQWSTTVCSWGTYTCLEVYSFVSNPIRQWFLESHDKNQLYTMIAQLKKENQLLQEQLINLQATNLYAKDTQELRNFKQRYDLKDAVIARVLAITSTEYEQTILINAGSFHGITKNMIVISHNCLVGKVIAVYPWYSKVRLVTDARCKVSAVCASTGSIGIYRGSNSSALAALDHVSHLETVMIGDRVLSAGKGLVFPQGFALGTVSSAVANGLSYDIAIKPLVSFSELSYCLVISKESCEKYS